MLRIRVLSLDGVSPASPLSAIFGEGVNSIGRDDSCTLALPDPQKHISRIQAQVKCLGGEFFLIDQGGNATHVNGRTLGKSNVASLHDGDRIKMAEWVLGVEVVQAEKPKPAQAIKPAEAADEEFDFNIPTQIVMGTPDQLPTPEAAGPVVSWGREAPPVVAGLADAPQTPVAPGFAARVSVEGLGAPLSERVALVQGEHAVLAERIDAHMRAVLPALLSRFAPEQLQNRLFASVPLDADDAAELWRAYEAQHPEILREAEDAIHDALSQAFVRASAGPAQ